MVYWAQVTEEPSSNIYLASFPPTLFTVTGIKVSAQKIALFLSPIGWPAFKESPPPPQKRAQKHFSLILAGRGKHHQTHSSSWPPGGPHQLLFLQRGDRSISAPDSNGGGGVAAFPLFKKEAAQKVSIFLPAALS